MARGRALVSEVLPLLDPQLVTARDEYAAARLREMCERYAGFIERERERGRELERGRSAGVAEPSAHTSDRAPKRRADD
jgi:hypothetical protein